ncbi:glycosyltransferase family 2 protein [Bacillus sp. NPDC094077]|uniref:glycosyltransferase family 2 protein n=1 Tax=Bacillus sp. NPDC094077 TaxID=3390932 RepID=UPI003D04A056
MKGGILITTTLISHFYNEEYLLPWWLMHHTKLFDHGILINRGSTDRSVEICRQFAPHWEVRNSKVPDFDAISVDQEVMEIETEVTGWKMVLNTTEFLCCFNKDDFFLSLSLLGENMYSIRVIMMVDDPNYGYKDPIYELPLVKQRYHGLFPKDLTPYVGRLIHNHVHGSYTAGRHWSPHKFIIYLYPAFILKFFYSPWNNAMKKRKLQIGPTLSAHSIQHGLGTHHLALSKELDERFLTYASATQDLRLIPEYKILFPDL